MQKGKNMGIMTTLKKTYPRKPLQPPSWCSKLPGAWSAW
jgi:hypothetical protein